MGSGSRKVVSGWRGQRNASENRSVSGPAEPAGTTIASPSPSLKQVASESARRSLQPWSGSVTTLIRSTTTITSRLVARSGTDTPGSASGASRSVSSAGFPSASTLAKPSERRFPATSRCETRPLRERGKAIITLVPGGRAATESVAAETVSGRTSSPHPGQWVRPTRAKSRRRKSYTSVAVPTVERLEVVGLRCSIATAGASPSIRSTSGFSRRSRNCLA